MFKSELTEILQIDYPIIQAPMAGGVTTPELVAAVSNSGGLGSIGAGYMTPEQIRVHIKKVKELTSKPFAINLFVPSKFEVTKSEMESASQNLQSIRTELNVIQDDVEVPIYENMVKTFNEQIKLIIEEKVPVCSFTFGVPSLEVIETLKKNKIIVVGTATTVGEAAEVEKSGMDIVVLQGSEAGGHRGNFMHGDQESLIGLMSLIPQVADQVEIPVIAAGGIMDGRGLMASLCLGAKGVQMGTAFLTCEESGAHQVHKKTILQASEDQTVLTKAFSGKTARGLNNQFIVEAEELQTAFPEFPVQNALTQSIRKAAAQQNKPEYMSLWSGQSPRLAREQTVAELMEKVIFDALNIINTN